MRLLSFKCPECKMGVMTPMMTLLNYSQPLTCTFCKSVITPAMVFGDGGLDRETELLACIGQATGDFIDFVQEAREAASEQGLSMGDPAFQMPIMFRSRELAIMWLVYKGDNYERKDK